MTYKALLLDLDGTTVIPFTNDVSAKVKDAIAKAHERVFVSIATGRPLEKALPVIEQLALSGLCVINNGTQIFDPKTKTVVLEHCLPHDTVGEVYSILKKEFPNIWVSALNGDQPADNWQSLEHITGVVVVDAPIELVATLIQKVQHIPGITTHRMFGSKAGVEFLEVVNVNATKQLGIYEIAKREGIQTSDIIGVGDSYNDFPLLMACGLKIAMGNALPELKAVADFVAPTVEEDGVAAVIEKYIING